jgi:WD40 repeat protein
MFYIQPKQVKKIPVLTDDKLKFRKVEENKLPPCSFDIEMQVRVLHHFPQKKQVCLTIHPILPHVAVASQRGLLQALDYQNGLIQQSISVKTDLEREFDPDTKTLNAKLLAVHTLTFNPKGDVLAVACEKNRIFFYSYPALKELNLIQGSDRWDGIFWEHIQFSPCGHYLALSDNDFAVTIFSRSPSDKNHDQAFDWKYLGKLKCHQSPILGIGHEGLMR